MPCSTLVTKPPSSRPFRALPPLLSHHEGPEGVEILQEVPDDLGGLLWALLRNLTAWVRSDTTERGPPCTLAVSEHVHSSQEQTPWLAHTVRQLEELDVDPTSVANICEAIAVRAEEAGWRAAALAFTQTAALALPADAERAHRVARRAQRAGEDARAESWSSRAAYLTRRARDRSATGKLPSTSPVCEAPHGRDT